MATLYHTLLAVGSCRGVLCVGGSNQNEGEDATRCQPPSLVLLACRGAQVTHAYALLHLYDGSVLVKKAEYYGMLLIFKKFIANVESNETSAV